MRKILPVLLMLACGTMNAQHYTRDAGIRLGDYFSATYRQYLDDDKAIEGIFFWGRHGITLTAMKEYFQPAFGHVSEYLYFQYGFGAHLGYRYTDSYKVFNRTYRLEKCTFTPLIGVDGLAGLEYRFNEFPVVIGTDIRPYFEYSTTQIFSIYLQSVGISIKYKF